MEAALVLGTVVQRYHFELVPGQSIMPQPSLTLRPREGVRMVLHARS
jgi:cytochrome P450